MINASFLTAIDEAYRLRGRNVVVLTGNVHDLQPYANRYLGIEQALYQTLSKAGFLVMRGDMSNGLSFFTNEDEAYAAQVLADAGEGTREAPGVRNLRALIEATFQSPSVMLFRAQQIERKFGQAMAVDRKVDSKAIRPPCIILQYAAGLFPANSPDRMSESDRLRLISFLSWVNNPLFIGAGQQREALPLVILVADTKSEVSDKITELPHCTTISLGLPDAQTRDDFVRKMQAQFETDPRPRKDGHTGPVILEHDTEFVRATAGLTLQVVSDLMETAYRTTGTVTKQMVVDEITRLMGKQLDAIVTFVVPEHTVHDIVGYEKTKEVFRRVLKRLNDPKRAVPAVLIPGPNGSGKTFIGEAFAAESGWAVIELSGLRGSWFGETEKQFEKLRMFVEQFGKVMIFVDEAHTAFASVHRSEVHETEKRLAGNLIKMMGNPRLRGKVVWILMTSRPDELDPDIIRRAPIQIPIMDLEDGERKEFIRTMFARKKIVLDGADLEQVYGQTLYYSASDFDNLIREVVDRRCDNATVSVLTVMQGWRASTSIVGARNYQSLVAAKFCTYPDLLPAKYRELVDTGQLEEEITAQKRKLYGIFA